MSMVSVADSMRLVYVSRDVSGEKKGVTLQVDVQYVGVKRAS